MASHCNRDEIHMALMCTQSFSPPESCSLLTSLPSPHVLFSMLRMALIKPLCCVAEKPSTPASKPLLASLGRFKWFIFGLPCCFDHTSVKALITFMSLFVSMPACACLEEVRIISHWTLYFQHSAKFLADGRREWWLWKTGCGRLLA